MEHSVNRYTVTEIIKGTHIKGEAIKLCMGLRTPSEYYHVTQLIQAARKLNDDTDMGESSRTRMIWRSRRQYKHNNATYKLMMEAKKRRYF